MTPGRDDDDDGEMMMQIELEVRIIVSNTVALSHLVKRDYSWNTCRGYAGICSKEIRNK